MAAHPIHASIVLNIHREAIFLQRTLLSLAEAARFAQSRGARLELVAVLDRSDEATVQVLKNFDLRVFEDVVFVEVDHGSLGPARNDGIRHSSGEFIFTADADDLVSYNYFHDILAEARRQGRNTLLFPELLLGFGDDYLIVLYEGSEAIPPKAFVDVQPYISRVCAHREIFLSNPYADVPLTKGYAYEDWHFNAEAAASGVEVCIVKGTILFYRQRPGSVLRVADAISIRQIPPTRLFEPSTFLELTRRFERSRQTARGGPQARHPQNEAVRILERPQTKEVIARANAIEPSISAERYRACRVFANFAHTFPLGTSYLSVCEIIRERDFSDVFLLPFMARGGAEKYFLHLMEAMYAIDPFKDILVILGEDLEKPKWIDRLPPNVIVVDMAVHCRSLSLDQRCTLALKVIETCSPETRIHLRQSAFADRFLALYGIVLKDRESIYYRFPDVERIREGRSTILNSPIGLIADNINYLSKIVCDSETTIQKDHDRLGLRKDKWHCLHVPIEMPAILPHRDIDARGRLLWASRLDTEKRYSLLGLIASRLRRDAPEASIDVFGGSVFEGFSPFIFERHPNLHYHGAYDGFDQLPLSRYMIFIYTSLHDGIPNVVLEAMSHGLAVIAPDVGGISEAVIDGETGILLPSLADDRAMASSYVQAIRDLLDDTDRTQMLADKARSFVRRFHSPAIHKKRVAELFGLQERLVVHA